MKLFRRKVRTVRDVRILDWNYDEGVVLWIPHFNSPEHVEAVVAQSTSPQAVDESVEGVTTEAPQGPEPTESATDTEGGTVESTPPATPLPEGAVLEVDEEGGAIITMPPSA